MDSKNKSGFTLVEVLLALTIIGLVLSPIFVIQSSVLRSTSKAAQIFTRLLIAKDFLIDQQFEHADSDQAVTTERKITVPPTKLVFSSKKVPDNSSLKKIKNIMVESVAFEWTDAQGRKQQQKLVTFSFKPEQEKSS